MRNRNAEASEIEQDHESKKARSSTNGVDLQFVSCLVRLVYLPA